MCVQERERQISGGAREVAELQQQFQLKERERESLVEQLERKQEELESEREEKERSQQELVRQTQMCFIKMLIVLFESVFLQLFHRRQLSQAQSANQTQQLELVRYYMHGEKVQFRFFLNSIINEF